MKVLGIDPASEYSAGALVEDKQARIRLIAAPIWNKDDRQSPAWNLQNYFHWVRLQCMELEPDIAAIESLSVTRGAQVTRKLAFYQAASVLGCKEAGITVIEIRVKTARRIALGDGSLDKRACHDRIKKMFPGFKFQQFRVGGGDQTDAAVVALAGPDAAEM